MKCRNQVLAIAILMVASFSSCKKDDNSSSTSSVLSSTIQDGTWKITKYVDSGNDETNHYTGSTFDFVSGGGVNVTGTIPGSGTWTSGNDDSQLKLVLDFGSAIPYSELNDDWHVIAQSSSVIKLEDVSGGGGGTDYLTFEKN